MTGEARMERLREIIADEQCPDRCGGRVGHPGPHQSSDYVPLTGERLAAALNSFERAAGESFVVETNPGTHRANCAHVVMVLAALATPGTPEGGEL